MSRLCTLCARAGSKGVQNKNIRELCGKPLLAHSIEQAKNAQLFDVIAISSDSEKILDLAAHWGADQLIHRPAELAGDEAAKLPAIQHCVKTLEQQLGYTFNTFVDLDVTAPLREVADILAAVQLVETGAASNVISACIARRSPYFNMVEYDLSGQLNVIKQPKTTLVRRQDTPICYDLNASIYVWNRDSLLNETSLFLSNTQLYLMPEISRFDIDSEFDFELVNYLMQRQNAQPNTLKT